MVWTSPTEIGWHNRVNFTIRSFMHVAKDDLVKSDRFWGNQATQLGFKIQTRLCMLKKMSCSRMTSFWINPKTSVAHLHARVSILLFIITFFPSLHLHTQLDHRRTTSRRHHRCTVRELAASTSLPITQTKTSTTWEGSNFGDFVKRWWPKRKRSVRVSKRENKV